MSNERSKEWVLERIKKLLTLGRNDGATEGERDNAMRMAHNLMTKYNLDASEAEAHGEAIDEARGFVKASFYGRPWARTCANSLAKLFFCKYIYSSATKANDTTHYFFGKQTNATVAASMAEYVVNSIMKEARRSGKYQDNAWRRSFSIGAAATIHQRVNAMIEASKGDHQPGMSLVLASVYAQEETKNALVVAQKFPVMAKGRSGKPTGSIDAYGAGKKFGASINLNRQLN